MNWARLQTSPAGARKKSEVTNLASGCARGHARKKSEVTNLASGCAGMRVKRARLQTSPAGARGARKKSEVTNLASGGSGVRKGEVSNLVIEKGREYGNPANPLIL